MISGFLGEVNWRKKKNCLQGHFLQPLLVSPCPADRELPALRELDEGAPSCRLSTASPTVISRVKEVLRLLCRSSSVLFFTRIKGQWRLRLHSCRRLYDNFYVHFLLLFFKSRVSSAAVELWVECKAILARQKHWDEYFPQDTFIFVDEGPTTPCRGDPSKLQIACETFQSSASEMLLPKSCFGGFIPFYFLILQRLILVQHAKLVKKKKVNTQKASQESV